MNKKNKKTNQVGNHDYVAPNVKVVAFMVEEGFGVGGSLKGSVSGTVTFGGTADMGLMDHTDANDHSGLGQYIDRGSIFGD